MKFTKEELVFIRTVLQIDAQEEENREEVLDDIWEAACDIEVEESNRLEELTPRGKLAVGLVTKLGEF